MHGWICSIVNIVIVDVVDMKLVMIIALENVMYDLVSIRVNC